MATDGMIEEQATVFNVFADPTRLKLVRFLCRQRTPDALCVNALAERLGVTQSAVSQHLRVLKGLGLVKGERRGNRIHYSVIPEVLARCRELVSAALSIEDPREEESCEKNCPNRRRHNVSTSERAGMTAFTDEIRSGDRGAG